MVRNSIENMNIIASVFNGILIIWNCISLLAEQATISLNSVGILWIFNFSNAILVSERYFPEIIIFFFQSFSNYEPVQKTTSS